MGGADLHFVGELRHQQHKLSEQPVCEINPQALVCIVQDIS